MVANLFLITLSLISPTHKKIVIDLNKLKWFAYQSEKLIASGKAIGGSRVCSDNRYKSCRTPVGTFKIIQKYGYYKRSIKYPLTCRNFRKCGAKMYYFMKFHKAGIGMHGSDEINVNKNVSHGCIRLFRDDAKWLNQQFVDTDTQIVILSYK